MAEARNVSTHKPPQASSRTSLTNGLTILLAEQVPLVVRQEPDSPSVEQDPVTVGMNVSNLGAALLLTHTKDVHVPLLALLISTP